MKAAADKIINEILNDEVHKNIPEVKKLQHDLLSYNRFQNYILNLSSSFIKIPFSKIDDAIIDSLKHFCDLYHYDHSSIWTFDDNERMITCQYKWSKQKYILPNESWNVLKYAQVEGLFDFKGFRKPIFLRFSDFKPQNILFSMMLKMTGIKALYVFPLINEGENIGGLVLSTHQDYEELDENINIAGQLYCTLITSVLLRKANETALKESSKTNNLILDSINEGVGLYDRDGTILYLNKYIQDALGTEFQTGKKIYDQIIAGFEDLCHERTDKFNYVIQTGEKLVYEDNLNDTWFSNRLYPILKDGQVSALTVITEDITDLKKAEALLREAKILKDKEHDYLEILDGSTVASWIHDYDNNILRLSQEWRRRIGYENIPDKDLLSHMDKIMHPDDLKKIQEERKLIFKTKQVKFKHEYRIKTISSDYFWVMDQGKIIYNTDGTPSKVYGTTMDIDDAKKAIEESRLIESALKQSERHALNLVEELQRADKNKNDFINMLSHELRNPLATIVAGLSLINRSTNKLVNTSTIEIIDRQVKQLCKLVDDLLDLTRINNNKIMLKKEMTNLKTLVTNTYTDLMPFFEEKRIAFTLDLPVSCCLMLDQARVKQILENLLHNALNYTDYGGKVSLTVFTTKKDAVISIRDTGIGLAPEIVPFIFEPFTQAENSLDRSQGGLGLGLAIVKSITELHDGHVYANSEGLGKGSEFAIHLPLVNNTI